MTRRAFIEEPAGATAGIALVGCDLMSAVPAQAQARRREMVVNGQIVMGTDYPFPRTKTSVDHILNTPGLSDAERVAMLGGTAAKLLGITA